MKYKSKFSAAQKHFHTSYTMRIDEGQSFTDVEGLTPGVFYKVGMITVKHAALQWIDANKPQAWFRPMFL